MTQTFSTSYATANQRKISLTQNLFLLKRNQFYIFLLSPYLQSPAETCFIRGLNEATGELKEEGKIPMTVTGMVYVPCKYSPRITSSFLSSQLPFAVIIVSLQSGVLYVYCSERWTVSTDLTDRGKVCFSVNVVFLLFYLRFSQDNILRLSRPIDLTKPFFPQARSQSFTAIKFDAEIGRKT